MADSYRVIAAVPSSELIGGSQVQDVQQVTVMAVPSRVTFPVRIPSALFGPESVHAAAEPIAMAINELAADSRVSAVVVTQDVDASGQLVDTANVTVRTADGALASTVAIPLSSLLDGTGEPELDAAVKNLQAVAGL